MTTLCIPAGGTAVREWGVGLLLRRLLLFLLVFLSLVLALELTFAFGARRLAVSLARSLGGMDISVGAVRADPLRGLAVLEDVSVMGGPEADGGRAVYVKEIDVKARYSLAERRLTFERVTLLEPDVRIERLGDGTVRVPGVWSWTPGAAGASPAHGLVPTFGAALSHVEVKGGRVQYTDRIVSPEGVVLTVVELGGGYERSADGGGVLSFTGLLEGRKRAPVRVEARLAGGAPWRDFEGSGGIVGMDVADAYPFMKEAWPLRLTGGSLTWSASFTCVDGYLRSRHLVFMEGLTVATPPEGFLQGGVRALKAGELADYIQSQAGKISFEFSVEGPLEALRKDRADLMTRVVAHAISRRVDAGASAVTRTLRTITEGVADVIGVAVPGR